MSVGRQLLLVNNGAPGARDDRLRAGARATASHNTLCLAEQSSSRLIRSDRLEQRLGSAPLSEPSTVQCEITDTEDGMVVRASHNGYADRFGLFHTRLLDLSPLGNRLSGKDRLVAHTRGSAREGALPFAVHFHLHPSIATKLSADAQAADLYLPNGDKWRFEAIGAPISIEESVFVAHPAGPRLAEQLVLRGLCAAARRSIGAWRRSSGHRLRLCHFRPKAPNLNAAAARRAPAGVLVRRRNRPRPLPRQCEDPGS